MVKSWVFRHECGWSRRYDQGVRLVGQQLWGSSCGVGG